MPCSYKNYPSNWKTEIRPRILFREDYCCKFCGVENQSKGVRSKDGEFISVQKIHDSLDKNGYDFFDHELKDCVNKEGRMKVITIVLTISHLDHDTKNNEDSNLAALCKKCHLNHDKKHHMKNTRTTIESKKKLQRLF